VPSSRKRKSVKSEKAGKIPKNKSPHKVQKMSNCKQSPVLTLTPANINAFVSYIYAAKNLAKMMCTLPSGKVITISKDDEEVEDEESTYNPRPQKNVDWSFIFSPQDERVDLRKVLEEEEMDPDEVKELVSQIKNATHVRFSSVFKRIVNKSGCNKDTRGMLVKELQLPYNNSVDVPSYKTILTINEAASLFWTVKSHHFDYWYELTNSCGAVVEQTTGVAKYDIVIRPDHGS
jgi:hypothetical protein